MKALALVIIAVVPGTTLFAQSAVTWPPPAGIVVRVESPVLGGEKFRGTLVSADNDSIVLRPAQLNNRIAVPTASVTRMAIASGTHTRRLKATLIGLGVGAGAGFAIGAATWKKPKATAWNLDFGRYGDAAFTAGFAGIAGAIAGLIAGSFATESWQAVDLPRK